jgi:glycosyltransferase involved in cell wall biosynthesis
MHFFPIFLSIVVVVRDQAETLEKMIISIQEQVNHKFSEVEIILVDNASTDNSVLLLKQLTLENGLPNLQIYALTKTVDTDTATWVGMENALGDFVVTLDPRVDDIAFLISMMKEAMSGSDVVFARNERIRNNSVLYRYAYNSFNSIFQYLNGIDLSKDAPQYRVLSKRVINYILQHPQPAVTYRHMPASGGFSRTNLHYSYHAINNHTTKNLRDDIDRGIRLLVSTTKAPMRLVTSLSLFGAIANLMYSVYVVIVGFLKVDVAAGWISLSLQQSGMFFLISLVLLILGEYILQMASLSNEGPMYYVGQEFTSARMLRREKLNIEEVSSIDELIS